MQTQSIDLGLLQASAQPRAISPADVDKLAASIKQVGLIQPITVRQVPAMHKGLAEQVFQIVAGHHRVAAARSLGWTEIDAVVMRASGFLEAELIEIDENLVRSELTPGQRSHYISRRAEICEALAPYVPPEVLTNDEHETGGNEISTSLGTLPDGRKKGPQHQKSFAAQTAELTGESKQSINQYRAIGDALGDDALRVSGTSLDKKAELTALAKMPAKDRAPLIARAVAGEKVTARPAPVKPPVAALETAPLELPKPEIDFADVITTDAPRVCPVACFAGAVTSMLSSIRQRLGCATNRDAAILVSRALDDAPDSLFAVYHDAANQLDDFLQIAESTAEAQVVT